MPIDVLTRKEVNAFFATFSSGTRKDKRNLAMATLMYRAELKLGEIQGMQRGQYEPGKRMLTLPATKRYPERSVQIDSATQAVLDAWLEARRELDVSGMAPMFCTLLRPTTGGPLSPSYIRKVVENQAKAAGLEKRVTSETLRRTRRHERRAQRIGSSRDPLVTLLSEESLHESYPQAVEKWRDAWNLLTTDPQRFATDLGLDCREALLMFTTELADRHGVEVAHDEGTISRLRAIIAAHHGLGKKVQAFSKALISYWRAVSELGERQVHAARREKEQLEAEDARRLVFHTLVVMQEVDRTLARAASAVTALDGPVAEGLLTESVPMQQRVSGDAA